MSPHVCCQVYKVQVSVSNFVADATGSRVLTTGIHKYPPSVSCHVPPCSIPSQHISPMIRPNELPQNPTSVNTSGGVVQGKAVHRLSNAQKTNFSRDNQNEKKMKNSFFGNRKQLKKKRKDRQKCFLFFMFLWGAPGSRRSAVPQKQRQQKLEEKRSRHGNGVLRGVRFLFSRRPWRCTPVVRRAPPRTWFAFHDGNAEQPTASLVVRALAVHAAQRQQTSQHSCSSRQLTRPFCSRCGQQDHDVLHACLASDLCHTSSGAVLCT